MPATVRERKGRLRPPNQSSNRHRDPFIINRVVWLSFWCAHVSTNKAPGRSGRPTSLSEARKRGTVKDQSIHRHQKCNSLVAFSFLLKSTLLHHFSEVCMSVSLWPARHLPETHLQEGAIAQANNTQHNRPAFLFY